MLYIALLIMGVVSAGIGYLGSPAIPTEQRTLVVLGLQGVTGIAWIIIGMEIYSRRKKK